MLYKFEVIKNGGCFPPSLNLHNKITQQTLIYNAMPLFSGYLGLILAILSMFVL